MVRQHETSDAQLRIGESRDSGFDASHRPGMTILDCFAEPVIGRAFSATRWLAVTADRTSFILKSRRACYIRSFIIGGQ
jgi:hypothetical protein